VLTSCTLSVCSRAALRVLTSCTLSVCSRAALRVLTSCTVWRVQAREPLNQAREVHNVGYKFAKFVTAILDPNRHF
jgi:hypothetical protein